MSKKHPILIGTFILTATGFLSRVIGFFFRIFLSHTFGEEQVGLYQLIFPLYALCFSFTSAGIETAISRCVAQKISLNQKKEASRTLFVGLAISLLLSLIAMFFLQKYTSFLSIYILGDLRCETMLLCISYALPFAAIHSCICGYYFGLKETKIPAISQLVEQIVRVASVYIIYQNAIKHNGQPSILFAVIGIVIGELCSAFFCAFCFLGKMKSKGELVTKTNSFTLTKELLNLSIPLTSSRILLNILQSVESISIPLRLQLYGYTTSQALSNYGVLTGMALPCILFPSAITNSISTILLPTVAQIQATKNHSYLKSIIQKVCSCCFFLGLGCFFIFFSFSSLIGDVLFQSKLAGDYLKILAWICPFLYLNATLISITNGLGKATISLLINTIGLIIRITGVLVFIPCIGMNGYLWGLLLSQFVTCGLCIFHLFWHQKKIA